MAGGKHCAYDALRLRIVVLGGSEEIVSRTVAVGLATRSVKESLALGGQSVFASARAVQPFV